MASGDLLIYFSRNLITVQRFPAKSGQQISLRFARNRVKHSFYLTQGNSHIRSIRSIVLIWFDEIGNLALLDGENRNAGSRRDEEKLAMGRDYKADWL